MGVGICSATPVGLYHAPCRRDYPRDIRWRQAAEARSVASKIKTSGDSVGIGFGGSTARRKVTEALLLLGLVSMKKAGISNPNTRADGAFGLKARLR